MKKYHLHLISDSTGGTLNSVVKACLAQFDQVQAEQHFWPLVRTQKQMLAAVEGIRKHPGLVLYTLVDDALAKALEKHCQTLGLQAISILHPVIALMSRYFGQVSRAEPGLQHQLNEEYFARMDAVDYALHHDDGLKNDRDMAHADVILVGVSRTSKTPTCVYLANRGIKAANVPYVPGIPFPEKILELKKPLFVGLTASPDRLIDIRRNRLSQLGELRETDYLDTERVQDEVKQARRFYSKMDWPVIDVTRRSIEETAAEILALLEAHRSRLKESA
ncbi:MAG TPA: pyruvate, water dikinase regulatory protein [Patescibacteria group bacterium]|nr:pyruvate, water dikinase regulatory protein [Patescibacteria group bacterium]